MRHKIQEKIFMFLPFPYAFSSSKQKLKHKLNIIFFLKERRRRKKTENSYKTLHKRIERTLRMRTTLSRSRRRIGLKQTIGGKKKKEKFRVLSLRKKEKDRETIIEEENYYSRIKLESQGKLQEVSCLELPLLLYFIFL